VIEVGLLYLRWGETEAEFPGFFQRALAIIPPHQQLFHEALSKKFDLP